MTVAPDTSSRLTIANNSTTKPQHLQNSMAPPRKSSTSRPSRRARKTVDDEINHETHANCTDVEDEAEDDELDASQGTAFQKVIVQGLQDVCVDSFTHLLT